MATEAKAKHTAGPLEMHVVHDVTGYPCFFVHGFSGEQKSDVAALDGYRRLFAAAPDLLAALQDCRRWLAFDDRSNCKANTLSELLENADAAIRKATH